MLESVCYFLLIISIHLAFIQFAFKRALKVSESNIKNLTLSKLAWKGGDSYKTILIDLDPTDNIRYLTFLYKFIPIPPLATSIKTIRRCLESNKKFLDNPTKEFTIQEHQEQLDLALSFYFHLTLWVAPLSVSKELYREYKNDTDYIKCVHFKKLSEVDFALRSDEHKTRIIEIKNNA